MEISPVAIDQLHRARDGGIVEVSGSAGAIVRDLHEIDETLRVNFNEAGEYFCVYQLLNEHRRPDVNGCIEEVVLRVPMMEWDRRVVEYFNLRAWEMRHGKSPAARLEAAADKRKAEIEHAQDEQIGEIVQRLYRPFQRALVGSNPRIVLPRGVEA